MKASLHALAWRAVHSRDYHEDIWKALPAGLEPPDFAARSRFLLERVRPGERVLDLGCGEGRFAAELARAGVSVLGADIAQEPLRRARALHGELDLRLLDGEGSWGLDGELFDVVWAGEVIEHVRDTAAWLSQLRGVLRSGGRLLLSTPAHDRLTMLGVAISARAFAQRLDPLSDHLRFYSRATLTSLISEFGFRAIELRSVGGLPGARRTLLLSAERARF